MVPRLIMIMKIWSLMTHFYGASFQGHYFCRNNVYVNSELLINVQYMSSLFFFILTTDIFLKLHTFFPKVHIIKQNLHKTYGWKKIKIQK